MDEQQAEKKMQKVLHSTFYCFLNVTSDGDRLVSLGRLFQGLEATLDKALSHVVTFRISGVEE